MNTTKFRPNEFELWLCLCIARAPLNLLTLTARSSPNCTSFARDDVMEQVFVACARNVVESVNFEHFNTDLSQF